MRDNVFLTVIAVLCFLLFVGACLDAPWYIVVLCFILGAGTFAGFLLISITTNEEHWENDDET